jgi:arginyl-tRNA synthetase
MQAFIEAIRAALAAETGLPADELKIESPRDPTKGDLAFPCFPLAKTLRQAPPKIAAELADRVASALEGIAVEAAGPYINFRIDRGALARSVLETIEAGGAAYGGSDEGAGRTVVLDFSSPNIAKPFHVGHLRSTIIGAALQRLHDALGYTTVGINHIGDWGSQFGKLVAAMQRWGDEVDLESAPIASLQALYERYHREEETDPELVEAGRAAFRELESGVDGEVRSTWKHLTAISLSEFDRIYDRLGVRFDHVRGEAFYEPFLDETVDRLVASGITEESEGALVVMLDGLEKNMPPCLLRKTDGTTLYATRDLAAVFHRWDEFAFDRCLYVVGSDQRLHFRQLKTVLKRMEASYEPRVEHVDFGMLRLPEGKLSTRQGRVVILEDLLNEAVSVARGIIAEKNPDLLDADAVAEAVGIGAVVFHDLKRERVKDVVFEWEEVLSFEGETGPYVQYTHARLASILRKAEEAGPEDAAGAGPVDHALLEDAAEILLALGRFPVVVRSAAANAEPSEVTRYVLELCREINSWYVHHRVLSDDAALSRARLALVRGAKSVIGNGLRLLGVAAPEEM